MDEKLARAYDALQQADAAGNVEDAQQIADYIRTLQVAPSEQKEEKPPMRDMVHNPITYGTAGFLAGRALGPSAITPAMDVATNKALNKISPPATRVGGVNVPPEIAAKGPNAVINWTQSQHKTPDGGGVYYGGTDYKEANARAKMVKQAAKETGHVPLPGSGILLDPATSADILKSRNIPTGLTPAIPETKPLSGLQRAAEAFKTHEHPRPGKLGMAVSGAMGAGQARDVYEQAAQGNVGQAALSTAGTAGSGLAFSSNPRLRALGYALQFGMPGLRYLTEPEKKAEGGLAGYSKGKKVVDVAKKFAGSLPPAENAARTQIIGTLPTYEKAGQILQAQGAGGRGLDFGAGLGEGAKRLLGRWDTYEPYAKGWNPTYSEMSQIPEEAYGQLTNLNVLNVVPREVRDELVQGIGRSMEPGGSGIITTRGKDVMSEKGRPGPEPMSIITSRDTYQKGFTPAELEEYLKYMLGQGYDINRLNLGPAGAMIRKKAEGGPVNMALGGEPFTALLKQIAKRRGVSKSDLPKITDIKSFNAGPAVIKPRPIAQGSELYRETNPQSLEDILRSEKQFDTSRFFVADNPDIALGQGSNVGANLVFRPDTLSGMQHLKPGTGNLAGREYITDLIAPKAIDYFSLNNASDLKNLSPFVRRQIQSNFERLEDPNFLSFARKKAEGGLAGYAAGGHATPAWQRKEGQNPEGGLNAAGRASYKRETGGELKRPQPEGGLRRDSFCARMKGAKKKLTSAKTANDPDSRINKSLRAWNC